MCVHAASLGVISDYVSCLPMCFTTVHIYCGTPEDTAFIKRSLLIAILFKSLIALLHRSMAMIVVALQFCSPTLLLMAQFVSEGYAHRVPRVQNPESRRLFQTQR